MNRNFKCAKHLKVKKFLIGLICGMVFFTVYANIRFFQLSPKVEATTLKNESDLNLLVSGKLADTKNHHYRTSDIENGSAWTTAGTASAPLSDQLFATTLVADTQHSAGLALFQGALDMTKAVHFSGSFTIKADGQSAMNGGDSLGFILTPDALDQISNNLPDSTGQYLGIGKNASGQGGLPSSVFLGRDLYYNDGFDTQINGMTAGVDTICIRSTDDTGNLEPQNQYAIAAAPDEGANMTETMSFSWTPQTINADGTTTGTLNYTVTPQIGGGPVSLSREMTVPNSLSLGVIGATGGNASTMTFRNDGSHFLASKNLRLIKVNYLDAISHQRIAAASAILSNVGDQIAVGDANDSTPFQTHFGKNYNFRAPKISGYAYESAEPVTVANNNSQNETNVINVYYETVPTQRATFNFTWTNGKESGNLPDSIIENGLLGDAISVPQIMLPKGYHVDKIVDPHQQSFQTLEEALAAVPTYTKTGNTFTLYLSKNQFAAAIPSNGVGSDKANRISSVKSASHLSENNQKIQSFVPLFKKQSEKNERFGHVQTNEKTPSLIEKNVSGKTTQQAVKTIQKVENYLVSRAQILRVRLVGATGIFVGTGASLLVFSILRRMLQLLKK